MEMTIKPLETVEKLLPPFHGQNAQLIAYVAAKGTATPEQIMRDLKMPRSTTYLLLKQFAVMGLLKEEKEGRSSRVSVPDFVFHIKNTAYIGEVKITPRNVLAFDAVHTSSGRMFAEHHGWKKFYKFVDLYDDYARGNITSQLMARELEVTRFEIELLLSDIKAKPRA